ncbi:hypothetical protein BDZ89DRAFT_1132477 [Hymenopellis radicata]|nr:hypothetical protein BDZ89DRAFT_1132477 [Hymenopellis radicata]
MQHALTLSSFIHGSLDADEYRLGGLRRIAYDADTRTYTFADKSGNRYQGVPGTEYTIASPVKGTDPVADRPEAFDSGKPRPEKIDVTSPPITFQDFLPARAIFSPTSSGSRVDDGSPSPDGRSRFMDAARRATLPKFAGVVEGLKRSTTMARKPKFGPDDEKRGLLRNPSVASSNSAASFDEKRGLGRSATTKNPPRAFSLRRVEEDNVESATSAPPLAKKFSLRKTDSEKKGTTKAETKVERSMEALSLEKRHPSTRKPEVASSHRRYHTESQAIPRAQERDEPQMKEVSKQSVSRHRSSEKKQAESKRPVAEDLDSRMRDLPAVPSSGPKDGHASSSDKDAKRHESSRASSVRKASDEKKRVERSSAKASSGTHRDELRRSATSSRAHAKQPVMRVPFISRTVSTVLPAPQEIDADTSLTKNGALPAPMLQIKSVDSYYSTWYKAWKYRNTSSSATVESMSSFKSGEEDPWKDFSFRTPTLIQLSRLWSRAYILKAFKDVIRTWPGLDWNSDPASRSKQRFGLEYCSQSILQINPEIFLTYLEEFKEYRGELIAKKSAKDSFDSHVLSSVSLLLSTSQGDDSQTIERINNLRAHGEVTWDLLYSIFVPRIILIARCAITSSRDYSSLNIGPPQTVVVGKVQTQALVEPFQGTVRIDSLDAYPLRYHLNAEEVKCDVLARGQKWVSRRGVHHKQFDGIAFKSQRGGLTALSLHNTFPSGYAYTNYANGVTVSSNTKTNPELELSDEDLLLTPTVVYGVSLSDNLWCAFEEVLTNEATPHSGVQRATDVTWNTEAFQNLVLPSGQNNLLRSLVEAHDTEIEFDDFIKGKGRGLVVNLFGLPGVGTFSAEATSEHVKKPLYIVGVGHLETHAEGLDTTLERSFQIATVWKAIVLIDEADVAVFLRHVEYYRGILFLTTNRVKVFDQAFLSRIRVALHFQELPEEPRKQEVEELSKRNINGGQIKNAVRTALPLATGNKEKLSFTHFQVALDAMEDFNKQFGATNVNESWIPATLYWFLRRVLHVTVMFLTNRGFPLPSISSSGFFMSQ